MGLISVRQMCINPCGTQVYGVCHMGFIVIRTDSIETYLVRPAKGVELNNKGKTRTSVYIFQSDILLYYYILGK